jgi:phage gp46-like protein
VLDRIVARKFGNGARSWKGNRVSYLRMKLLRDRRTLLVPGVGDVAVGIFVNSVDALRGATSRLFERRRYKETSRYDKKANPYITKGLASATAYRSLS